MLRVFMADDSPLVRERLAELISATPGVELVGQAETAYGAIQGIRRLQPEVVILDIRLAEGDGLQVLETVKAGESPPVVIMLTDCIPSPCADPAGEIIERDTTQSGKRFVTQKVQSFLPRSNSRHMQPF